MIKKFSYKCVLYIVYSLKWNKEKKQACLQTDFYTGLFLTCWHVKHLFLCKKLIKIYV